MEPSLIILAAWFAFGGSHLWLSASNAREIATSRIGSRGFTLLFTSVSIVTMIGLIISVAAYGGEGRLNPVRADLPAMRLFLGGLSGLGGVLAIGGLLSFPKSPMAVLARRMRESTKANVIPLAQPSAIERVTRHPFFVGLGLLAAGHIFLAGTLATATYFSGLAALSFVGIPLQDRKLRKRWSDEYSAYQAQTSAIPFAVRKKIEVAPDKSAWKVWTAALIGAAAFLGGLHPVWMQANGASFAIFILLFGLVGVVVGIWKGRSR